MRRRILLIIGLSLAGCGLTGCRNAVSSRPEAPPLLRSMARAVLMGDAYDRASRAARRDDRESFAAAAEELHRLDAAPHSLRLVNGVAGRIIQAASQFYALSQITSGVVRAQWLARADREFRYALRLAPNFDSSDPQILNSLGYFLAENGKTQADFREAEGLTRRALRLWDERLKKTSPTDPRLPALRFERAYSAHDSLAWALYRQGRYAEALVEQKKVVDTAAANASAAGDAARGPLADLHFHLAEIYRALKRPADAITYYRVALRFKPDHEETRRAFEALAGPLQPPPAPEPEPTAIAL